MGGSAEQELRSGRRGPAIAVAATCLFFLVLIAAYALKVRGSGFIPDDGPFLVSILTAQAVGLVLVLRRPRNAVGWIVCGLAWSMSAQELIESYTLLAAQRGWPLTLAAWINAKTFLLLWAGIIALFLYFPTGRLPSVQWRVPARFALGAVAFGAVVMSLLPGPLNEEAPLSPANPMNPTGLPPALWQRVSFLDGLALLLLAGALIVALLALVMRYRRSTDVERLQVRWVVAAASLFALITLASVTVRHVRPEWLDIADVAAGFAFVLLPLSVGVAVLKFHLYEIDRILSRTVAYGLLTVCLAGIYLGAVTALTALAVPAAGDAPITVAAATLLAAAAFGPARRRIQRAVDRRFNRARYDAAWAVSMFSTRLREEVDLDALTGELLGVVAATMQPRASTLWLRETTS